LKTQSSFSFGNNCIRMRFYCIINRSFLIFNCVLNSLLSSSLGSFDFLRCFVCLFCFLGMNFSHSFVCSFNDSLFFSLDTFINWFVNSCLLFNSFHLTCNISLFLYFSSSRCFISISNCSHNRGVWCFCWNRSWWKNLHWNLNWVWNRCFDFVWDWSCMLICDDFSWSWNWYRHMIDMVVMVMIHMMVVNIIIPWTWCSCDFKNIINSSIYNWLRCMWNTITLQFKSLSWYHHYCKCRKLHFYKIIYYYLILQK